MIFLYQTLLPKHKSRRVSCKHPHSEWRHPRCAQMSISISRVTGLKKRKKKCRCHQSHQSSKCRSHQKPCSWMTPTRHYKTVHANSSSLTHTQRHSTRTATRTRLGQKKNNSWIHCGISFFFFPLLKKNDEEECSLSPRAAALQVLTLAIRTQHTFVSSDIGTMYSIYLTHKHADCISLCKA